MNDLSQDGSGAGARMVRRGPSVALSAVLIREPLDTYNSGEVDFPKYGGAPEVPPIGLNRSLLLVNSGFDERRPRGRKDGLTILEFGSKLGQENGRRNVRGVGHERRAHPVAVFKVRVACRE